MKKKLSEGKKIMIAVVITAVAVSLIFGAGLLVQKNMYPNKIDFPIEAVEHAYIYDINLNDFKEITDEDLGEISYALGMFNISRKGIPEEKTDKYDGGYTQRIALEYSSGKKLIVEVSPYYVRYNDEDSFYKLDNKDMYYMFQKIYSSLAGKYFPNFGQMTPEGVSVEK